MAIITISRQLGSLGTEIAKKLKEDLNLNYLDKEFLEKELVNHYGLSEKKVARYDEKKPTFWDFSGEKERYRHFLKTIMYNFARKGNSILIGRGGQILFKGIPGTLNVRIFAPEELRIERITKKYDCNEAMAEHIIRHSDSDRDGFHRFFFDADWNDQNLYDLIVNTQTLSIATIVNMIKDAVEDTKIMEMNADTESRLADVCISQEVITSIQYIEMIPIRFFEVEASNGNVFLRGAASLIEHIKQCEDAARKVPGVKNVKNDIALVRYTNV